MFREGAIVGVWSKSTKIFYDSRFRRPRPRIVKTKTVDECQQNLFTKQQTILFFIFYYCCLFEFAVKLQTQVHQEQYTPNHLFS